MFSPMRTPNRLRRSLVTLLGAVTCSVSLAATTPATPVAEFERYCQDSLETIEGQKSRLEALSALPDQANFLLPLNELLVTLADAAKRSGLYASVYPDETMRQAAEACSRELDKLSTAISLSPVLYEILALVDQSKLDEETLYFVEVLLRDFRLAGVALEEEQRDQVKVLQEQITKTGQDFSRTLREDVRYLELNSVEQLRGLPEDYIATHQPDDKGVIHISTRYPDYIPFVTYAADDALRRQMFVVGRNRAFPENRDNLRQLIGQRHQLASLLGYQSYADWVTADKMIGNSENAAKFIEKVSAAAQPVMEQDLQRLLQRLQQEQPDAEQVQRWQLSYLQDKIKTEQYQVDAKSLRNYFAYGRVKQGVFDLVERLFQVQFKPWETVGWHSSVEAWEMWDGDNLIGRFYLDMHPREGKYQHAAMFPTVSGIADVQVPAATLVCNFPGEGDPLEKMEFGQVETFLHEFGHLLHELFAGHNRWMTQAGIATEWDFVEAPSQMLEEWVYDKSTLQSLAVNDAGEVLPDEIVEKLKAARNFNRGVSTRIQMFYAALSLNYYRKNPDSYDLDELMLQLEKQYSPVPPVEDTHFYANFGHLNGYSAIYYTYMWSQVIALDMFSRFEEEGLLNVETARDYRDKVLAAGGRKPAAQLVKDFLGREYSFDSFARRLNQANE